MEFFPSNYTPFELYSEQTVLKFEDAGRDGFCSQQDSAPSPLAIRGLLRPVAAWLTLPARCPLPTIVPDRSCPTSQSWSLTSPFPSACGKALFPPTSPSHDDPFPGPGKPHGQHSQPILPSSLLRLPSPLGHRTNLGKSVPDRHPSLDRPQLTKRSLVHRVEGPTSESARVRQASVGAVLVRGDLEVMPARGCVSLVISR